MKSKKLVIGYAIAVFLLIFIITFNSVCSITQFDVRFETGSAAAARSAETVQGRLNEYLNKSYLFFKESNVYDIVENVCAEENTHLNVVSVKKSFPNKISVRVEEEYEQYAFYSAADGKYYVTDENGKILAVRETSENNIASGAYNVEITGFTYSASEESGTLVADQAVPFSLLMQMLSHADETLGGVLGRFSGIEYSAGGTNNPEYLCFTFTQGVKLWLLDVSSSESHAYECFEAALAEYMTLSDAQKTYGYFLPVYVPGTGSVQVQHSSGNYDPNPST